MYVIDDRKTKNAFVLPGGKIFVFTGILPVSANDDGLATVLGHEVAHQGERLTLLVSLTSVTSYSRTASGRTDELHESGSLALLRSDCPLT